MFSDKSDLIILLVLVAVLVLYIYVRRKFKMPKVGSLSLVTGGVKSGKTTFSVAQCISNYNRVHRRWRIRKFFCKMFRRSIPEEPLFYSNIPLGIPYVEITNDLIERKTRFRYGSVIYISEATLLADNSIYKNMPLSERVMFFNKLIGHETRGGLLIYDTQAIGDLPAVTRRCLGQYFYVHHIAKWLPFFLVAYVRESRYSEDGSVISVDNSDTEDDLKRVLIRKSVWKKFDCYCYSTFTDDLPVVDTVIKLDKKADLSAKKIISFKEYKSLKK